MRSVRPFHVVIDALNLSHGGGAIVMTRLSDALLEAGCRVTVLTARPNVLGTAKRAPDKVEHLGQARGAFRAMLYRQFRLGRKLRSLDADAVVSFNYHTPVDLPQVTYHINVIPFLPWRQRRAAVGWLRALLQSRASRAAVARSTVNAFESRHIADMARGLRGPSILAYTGIDIPAAASARPEAPLERRICLISSGAAHKRNDVALRAFRQFLGIDPAARLVVFGQETAIRESLPDDLRRDNALMSCVEFRGYVDRETLYAELSTAFALLTASELESFYMVALEAMVVGTPVVATDISSVRESCGEAAHLFPAGDWQAAAAALGVLVDQTEWISRSRAGHAWARRFDADDLARRFVSDFLPMLQRG